MFRRTVGAADGLALSEVEHTHSFFGTLTVYQWVELVAAHASRHADQIVVGDARYRDVIGAMQGGTPTAATATAAITTNVTVALTTFLISALLSVPLEPATMLPCP